MDIKDLLVLQQAKQRHIMKALANLAKYNGVYDQWNRLLTDKISCDLSIQLSRLIEYLIK